MDTAARRSASTRDSGLRSVPLSARSRLERICAKNPTSILFARLADAYLRDGDVESALTACRRGLRYRPSYATGHLVMAACHRAQGLPEAARDEYRKVLHLDPDNVAALLGLGEVEPELGRPEVAARCLARASALDPFHPGLKQHPDKAKPADDEAQGEGSGASEERATDPEDGFAQDVALPEGGDASEAGDDASRESERVAQTGGGMDPEEAPFSTVTLAKLYADQGHAGRARAVLARILERDPEDERALALKKTIEGGSKG